MTPLADYLLVSALLFSIGFAGALTRRNAILVLIGIELMLNAANLNFIAFWRYGPNPEALTGHDVCDLLDRCRSSRSRCWSGPHHRHLPALQNHQSGPNRFDEGMRRNEKASGTDLSFTFCITPF